MDENDRVLLRVHRNELFQVCRHAGLDPSDFEWTVIDSEYTPDTRVSSLIHRPTGYTFVFDSDAGAQRHISKYSPGRSCADVETEWHTSIETQISLAKAWLMRLHGEVAVPDLWAASFQEKTLLKAASAEDLANEPFTPDEQEKVATWCRELREYVIATYDVSVEQRELLQRRLDYLAQASGRVGAKDWACMCGGALIGWLLSAALPSDAVRDVLRFAAVTLRHFLDWPFLLP